jgi:RNA polymerase sigma-70 factor (ECF subfamily)
MTDQPTAHLQRCLERLQAGDEAARKELLNGVCERLTQMTRTMLKDYRRLRRWEESGDVLQNALVRLDRALQQVTPATLRDFYRLATLQIRRELIDLARHHYGPEGGGRRHQSNLPSDSDASGQPAYEAADASNGPDQLALWSEFHQQVQKLPPLEREVYDLIYYQGLKFTEAAAVLNVSARTVTRHWHAANLKLHDALGGVLPGS